MRPAWALGSALGRCLSQFSVPLILNNRVMPDSFRLERESPNCRAQLMVKVLHQIQIRHTLFDLGRLGRLRELFIRVSLYALVLPGMDVPSTGSCVSSLSKRARIS